jgi:pilus assembly protein Flp/PilA
MLDEGSSRMGEPHTTHEGHRLTSDRGASLIEYALLISLIAIICFVAVQALGNSTAAEIGDFGSSLDAAGS